MKYAHSTYRVRARGSACRTFGRRADFQQQQRLPVFPDSTLHIRWVSPQTNQGIAKSSALSWTHLREIPGARFQAHTTYPTLSLTHEVSDVKHTTFCRSSIKIVHVRVHRPGAAAAVVAAASSAPSRNAWGLFFLNSSPHHRPWKLNGILASPAATTFYLHAIDATSCTIVQVVPLFLTIGGREQKLVHERPAAAFRAQALVVGETNQAQWIWISIGVQGRGALGGVGRVRGCCMKELLYVALITVLQRDVSYTSRGSPSYLRRVAVSSCWPKTCCERLKRRFWRLRPSPLCAARPQTQD